MKSLKIVITLFILLQGFIFLPAAPVKAGTMMVPSSDGVPIAFQVHGKGQPSLVFIHGWCCDKSFWDDQVPEFSKKYKVVTLDLGGHGESGTNRKEWTIQAFAQDAVAVVNHLKLKKVILIGHSMGGPVVVEAAVLLPGKVVGIIGVDTLLNVEQKFSKEQYELFLKPLRQNFKKGTEAFVRDWLFTPKSDPALVNKVVNKMASANPEIALGAMVGMFKFDLVGAMDKIKVPFRLIITDRFPCDVEAGRRHAISFDIKVMKGVSHFLMLEKPAAFNQLLSQTLEDLVNQADRKN